MEPDMLKTYLQNIEEFVLDEDKIVTYKWLSKTLGIHVNTAKQLLYVFLTEQKNKESGKVTATYLLAGKLKEGGHSVCIVHEQDLERAYSKFDQVTSEHVYSIKKGKSITNFQLLYAVDKSVADIESVPGPIVCSKSVLKPEKTVEAVMEVEKIQEKQQTKAIGSLFSKKSAVVKEVNGEEKNSSIDNENGKSPRKGNKNSVASLFAAQADKQKNEKKANKATTTSSRDTRKPGKISNFFSNAAPSKEEKTSPDADGEEKETTMEKSEAVVLTDIKREAEESAEDVSSKAKGKNGKNGQAGKGSSSKSKTEKKSKKAVKNVEAEGKKRKRIRVFSDSEDSDNESSGVRSPSPIPDQEPELEPEEESSTKVVVDKDETSPRNKRKKRKIVDELVMNEDGYMETKKEIVYNTDSDCEVDTAKPETNSGSFNEVQSSHKKKAKADQKSSTATTATSNVKKQSSLLSFFKKN